MVGGKVVADDLVEIVVGVEESVCDPVVGEAFGRGDGGDVLGEDVEERWAVAGDKERADLLVADVAEDDFVVAEVEVDADGFVQVGYGFPGHAGAGGRDRVGVG